MAKRAIRRKSRRARVRVNPLERPDVRQAAALARDFHGPSAGARVSMIPAPAPIRAALVVGKLDAVLYTTPGGERFKHTFAARSRPLLIASGDGKQLALVGGRFRMTGRGIVDH